MKKKKPLLNFLWFLVGMTGIAVIPLLMIERCSEPRKPATEETGEQKHGSFHQYDGMKVICGNPVITCHT